MSQKTPSYQTEKGRSAQPVARSRPPARRARRRGLPWGRLVLLLVVVAALLAIVWQRGIAQQPTASPTVALPVLPTPTPDARDHRWLARPLARTVARDFADRTYLFGTSKNNTYRVHHGLDMVNPTGTPVLAAGDGVVVFAGSDSGTRYGPSTIRNFYGNMVLVKLARTYRDQDVYYLCGHLDSVAVQTGQTVKTGDILGRIGMTGTADGPHLHFEVRVGGTTYAHSRNPALWMQNLPASGTLAGLITDKAGKPLPNVLVTLIKDINVSEIQKYWADVTTYQDDPLGKLVSDEEWGENLAVADLPAGIYEVRAVIGGQTHTRKVTIHSGLISWISLQEGTPLE